MTISSDLHQLRSIKSSLELVSPPPQEYLLIISFTDTVMNSEILKIWKVGILQDFKVFHPSLVMPGGIFQDAQVAPLVAYQEAGRQGPLRVPYQCYRCFLVNVWTLDFTGGH